MGLREIKTFKAVATLLNFNRAAEALLHCVQSTVSAQIKALDEDFGVPLFDRQGKRVFLTAAVWINNPQKTVKKPASVRD